MQLLDYLNDSFLTLSQLLSNSHVSETQLRQYQAQGVMPKASYRLKLTVNCDSFFGPHEQNDEVEYYAKGYTYWLGTLQPMSSIESAFELFSSRYEQKIQELKLLEYRCQDPKLNGELKAHIKSEWLHFLSGTYGLCTRSGLPEDIAAKELAIAQINELTTFEYLDKVQILALKKAVDLLDAVSSQFAPHERSCSSRHRLIDEMRRRYQLEARKS